MGKELVYLRQVTSTMDYAADMLAKNNPAPQEGTIVWADIQTQGRGQGSNTWLSQAARNLTISVILYPGFLGVDRQFLLNQAAAIALSDIVMAFSGKPTLIKWPNDIVTEGKKIAGILIQNTLRGDMLRSSVVGIGLNVNQTEFPKLALPATSLSMLTENTFERSKVCEMLCEYLERWYLKLKNGLQKEIENTYYQRLLHRDQMRMYARPDGSQFQARIVGVTTGGLLAMETHGGLQYFNTRQVRWLSLDEEGIT